MKKNKLTSHEDLEDLHGLLEKFRMQKTMKSMVERKENMTAVKIPYTVLIKPRFFLSRTGNTRLL